MGAAQDDHEPPRSDDGQALIVHDLVVLEDAALYPRETCRVVPDVVSANLIGGPDARGHLQRLGTGAQALPCEGQVVRGEVITHLAAAQ